MPNLPEMVLLPSTVLRVVTHSALAASGGEGMGGAENYFDWIGNTRIFAFECFKVKRNFNSKHLPTKMIFRHDERFYPHEYQIILISCVSLNLLYIWDYV